MDGRSVAWAVLGSIVFVTGCQSRDGLLAKTVMTSPSETSESVDIPIADVNPVVDWPTVNPTPSPTSRPTPPTGALGANASLGGRPIFPEGSVWNQDISRAPVDPNSDRYIQSIGMNKNLHPDFGTSWDGRIIGFPYMVVSGSQAKVPMTFDYANESDPGPYPIPANAPLSETGDRHMIVVDRDNWKLYELFYAFPRNNGWHAGSGAKFDLSTGSDRPEGWTSADAAGLPIFPGLVRYDEVMEQGEIRHALRFTVSRTQNAHVYPARHHASSNSDTSLPPMGMRVRLKSDFDISRYSPQAQVVLRALKKYGMFVADNGYDWMISGAHHPKWDDSALGDIKKVPGSAFEVIKMGPLIR